MARGLVKDGIGKVTPINRGLFERFTDGVNAQITSINPMAWMGPSQPIARVAPAGTQARIWDYRFGQNIDYTPKAFEGYCYDVLRDLADGFDLLRMVIETRKDQVSRVPHSFTCRPQPGEPPGKQKERQMSDKRIAMLEEFWKRPDGVHSFSDWQRAILEDMFVIDAPSIVPRWRRDGGIFGFDAIDGATISLLVDEVGRTPEAPNPAYRQIIKGMPAVDMMVPTASIKKSDCLFYYPRNTRTSKLYGYSPVEQIVMTTNIGLRRQMHQLQWYTDGTIPDVFLEAPEGMSEERFTQFEAMWNEKFASTAARRKANFIPHGSKVTFAKDPKLKDEMDEYLARKIAYAFSVSPAALIKMVNRAAGQQMSEDAKAEGLEPILFWFKEIMDDLLDFMGCGDIEYSLGNSNRENPLLQAQIYQIYLSTVDDQGHSPIRSNEVRDGLGMDQIDYEAEDAKDFQNQLDQQGQRMQVQNDNQPEPAPGANAADQQRRQQQVQHADEPRPKAAVCILCKTGMKAVGEGSKRHHVDQDGTRLLCYVGDGAKTAAVMLARKKKQKITRVRIDSSQKSQRHSQAVTRAGSLLKGFFKRQKSELVTAVTAKIKSKHKAEGDDDNDDVEDIIANILNNFNEIIDPFEVELAATYLDQASSLSNILEVESSVKLSILNKRALEYAQARAAEMVGKKWVDDELVDNPDAQWVITDTTRTTLKGLVENAFTDGMTPAELTGAIDDTGIFSPWRADLIASTEMATAQRQGARDTASDVGVIGRASETSGDHTEDNCDGSCDEAEARGVIGIDDDYDVDGHFQGPGCNCVEVFYTADDPEAADLLGDRAATIRATIREALKYSPDQARDDHGRWTADGGGEADAGTKDFKLSDGRTLKLSNDPDKKMAQVREFAKGEMAKLPPEVQKALNEGKTTVDVYKQNGEYTPERQALHEQIIKSALEGHQAQAEPKIVFVGGGPAAGKTAASDDAAKAIGDHVMINVDHIRTQMPEFTALLPDKLMGVNEELGDIRDQMINDARDGRYNVIIDGVGSASAANSVNYVTGAGYKGGYYYVHRPVEDAVGRAAARPFMTNKIADLRQLPNSAVESFHAKARGAFEKLAAGDREVKVYDKSDDSFGKDGKVVFWKGSDGSIKVYDPEGVKRVEDGGSPKIRIYP